MRDAQRVAEPDSGLGADLAAAPDADRRLHGRREHHTQQREQAPRDQRCRAARHGQERWRRLQRAGLQWELGAANGSRVRLCEPDVGSSNAPSESTRRLNSGLTTGRSPRQFSVVCRRPGSTLAGDSRCCQRPRSRDCHADFGSSFFNNSESGVHAQHSTQLCPQNPRCLKTHRRGNGLVVRSAARNGSRTDVWVDDRQPPAEFRQCQSRRSAQQRGHHRHSARRVDSWHRRAADQRFALWGRQHQPNLCLRRQDGSRQFVGAFDRRKPGRQFIWCRLQSSGRFGRTGIAACGQRGRPESAHQRRHGRSHAGHPAQGRRSAGFGEPDDRGFRLFQQLCRRDFDHALQHRLQL